MKFISFWFDKSGSDYYKNCFIRLKEQMDFLKYEYLFEELKPNKDSYEHITLHKPSFILDKLNQLNDSVCWIDIDCYFTKQLDLSLFVDDICLGKRDIEQKAPHSAVIYVSNNKKAKDFILDWQNRCEVQKENLEYEGGDHSQLILTYQNYDLTRVKINQIDNLCSVGINSYINIGISPSGWEAENKKYRKFGNF
jgi:hypothetical protein